MHLTIAGELDVFSYIERGGRSVIDAYWLVIVLNFCTNS